MKFEEQKVLQRNNQIYAVSLNDEMSMLDVESGKYYIINELGAVIWNYIEQPLTYKELLDKLVAEYDISVEACDADLSTYLEDLINKKLVFVV